MIKIVRVNEDCKERLITLKRYTGIQNWNVLCRWAFCISMADKTKVPSIDKKGEVGVEMTWRVFAGDLGDIFLALGAGSITNWVNNLSFLTDKPGYEYNE